jgi:CheY-like chemotaxis protein
MTLLLRRWGHKVAHVSDGRGAVEKAATMHADVALLDIGLPGIDGWEVARLLRATPGQEGLHLAALTGRGQDVDAEQSRQAGFDRHFVKPVEPDVLRAWLDEIAAAIQV